MHVWCVYMVCCMPLNAQDMCTAKHVNDSVNLHEVVVTARHSVMGANHVGSRISQSDITNAMGRSLGSLLEEVSGMSSIQTGTIVSKPVIHGMYGNRILLVSNGARLTGQQWGEDHAPEVDKNSYADIEVVKGAEAVKYGSERLAASSSCGSRPCPMRSVGSMACFRRFIAPMASGGKRRDRLRALSNGMVTGCGEYTQTVRTEATEALPNTC